MKVIPQDVTQKAQKEAYANAGHNAYYGNGFIDGVRFATEFLNAMQDTPNTDCDKKDLII